MTAQELQDRVEAHPDLEGIGVDDGMWLVKHKPSKCVSGVKHSALKETWETLCSILCFEQKPAVLAQYTRIVGYYSQTNNWNKSKLGELADRRKGDYLLK